VATVFWINDLKTAKRCRNSPTWFLVQTIFRLTLPNESSKPVFDVFGIADENKLGYVVMYRKFTAIKPPNIKKRQLLSRANID